MDAGTAQAGAAELHVFGNFQSDVAVAGHEFGGVLNGDVLNPASPLSLDVDVALGGGHRHVHEQQHAVHSTLSVDADGFALYFGDRAGQERVLDLYAMARF